MLKITTMFANKIPSANLIFKDNDNQAVNLVYFPELPNQGIDLINKYRKKNYWSYVIIPKTFSFLGHKILTNNYYKYFKQEIPQVRILRKFAKADTGTRSAVVDLTSLSEDFAAFAKSRSKKMLIEAFLNLVESFAVDNRANSDLDFYLVVDGDNTDQKEVVKALLYYSRLSNNKLRIKEVKGIVLYGNKRFWPLTIQDKDKDGDYLKVNINILSRFMKEVHLEDIDEEPAETKEESVSSTRKVVEALYKSSIGSETKAATQMFTDKAKKTKDETIEENPLELIKAEVQQNKNIPGRTFEEKLTNLFKEKTIEPEDSEKSSDLKKKDKKDKKPEAKIPTIVKKINENLLALNKRYNGTVSLDEKLIDSNASSFYKPLNIIGFKDFNAYGKQKSEFGENLDNAMFDLIKSMEIDTDLGIKVLNIKTSITDTYKDRLKTYTIKIQHKDFGYKKPYTVSFHVPIPSKGKYLKVGGNDYIMTNQFFSKPVIKISPKMVRVYTHYSTAAVTLKHHALNDSEGVDTMMESLSDTLKFGKKLKKKPEILEKDQIVDIINKYELPEFINTDIFVNLEIKSEKKEKNKTDE